MAIGFTSFLNVFVLSIEISTVMRKHRTVEYFFNDCDWTRIHNHLVCKCTLNHLTNYLTQPLNHLTQPFNYLASLAKWLSVRLRIKCLWVRVQLQLLKLQISPLL